MGFRFGWQAICYPEEGGYHLPSRPSLIEGLGFRVWGVGFRVQDLGFRVWGSCRRRCSSAAQGL